MEYDKNADPLVNIATGLHNIAYQIKNLGNANAGTQMGAIENLAKELREGMILISESIEAAIQNGKQR